MQRNRFESISGGGTGSSDLAARCGIETSAYVNTGGQWQLPEPSRIVSDLVRCGGSIPIFLTILLPDASSDEKSILLGVMLMAVREDYEAHEAFKKAREASEEASLIEVHELLYKTAKSCDVQAMKFVLERRFKGMFGKEARAIDDNEDFIRQKLRELKEQ